MIQTQKKIQFPENTDSYKQFTTAFV